jgi:hypothetical protein
MGARRACLTSPSLHLPESCDRNALRGVRSDAIPSWSRAGRGEVEWGGVVKTGCSVRATDVTEGTEVERFRGFWRR